MTLLLFWVGLCSGTPQTASRDVYLLYAGLFDGAAYDTRGQVPSRAAGRMPLHQAAVDLLRKAQGEKSVTRALLAGFIERCWITPGKKPLKGAVKKSCETLKRGAGDGRGKGWLFLDRAGLTRLRGEEGLIPLQSLAVGFFTLDRVIPVREITGTGTVELRLFLLVSFSVYDFYERSVIYSRQWVLQQPTLYEQDGRDEIAHAARVLGSATAEKSFTKLMARNVTLSVLKDPLFARALTRRQRSVRAGIQRFGAVAVPPPRGEADGALETPQPFRELAAYLLSERLSRQVAVLPPAAVAANGMAAADFNLRDILLQIGQGCTRQARDPCEPAVPSIESLTGVAIDYGRRGLVAGELVDDEFQLPERVFPPPRYLLSLDYGLERKPVRESRWERRDAFGFEGRLAVNDTRGGRGRVHDFSDRWEYAYAKSTTLGDDGYYFAMYRALDGLSAIDTLLREAHRVTGYEGSQ